MKTKKNTICALMFGLAANIAPIAVAIPPNDLCANATSIPASDLATAGFAQVVLDWKSAIIDPQDMSCDPVPNSIWDGIWYKVTPPSTCDATISVFGFGGAADPDNGFYAASYTGSNCDRSCVGGPNAGSSCTTNADCPGGTCQSNLVQNVGCGDPRFTTFRLVGGIENRIVIGRDGSDALALVYLVNISCGAPVGACCIDNRCTRMPETACKSPSLGGLYRGPGSVCSGQCDKGACCDLEFFGSCSDTTKAVCVLAGGTYAGDANKCRGDGPPCAPPPLPETIKIPWWWRWPPVPPPWLAALDLRDFVLDPNGLPGSCNDGVFDPIQNSGWIQYAAETDRLVTLEVTPDGFEEIIVLYRDAGATTAGNPPLEEVACARSNAPMTLTFPAREGDTYLLQVGQAGPVAGGGPTTLELDWTEGFGSCCDANDQCTVQFAVDCVESGGRFVSENTFCQPNPCTQPPSNDAWDQPNPIGCGSTPFRTVHASTDGPAEPACDFFGSNQVYNDLWYDYFSTGTGTLTVSTCNSADFDTKIAVYEGCDWQDLWILDCNDDFGGCAGFTSEVSVPVVPFQCYKIRLGSYDPQTTGSGTIELFCDICGDGLFSPGELCDNGLFNSDFDPDACRTNCAPAFCGDNVKDSGEECDGTDDLACPGECTNDCICVPPDPPVAGDDTCVGGPNHGDPCTNSAQCPAGTCGVKSRYVSFTPPPATVAASPSSAVRVIITAMSQFPARVGEVWWAGPPELIPNPPFADFTGALLECTTTPYTQIWHGLGTISCFGAAVAPESTYEISLCASVAGPCSDPLIVQTGKYGDSVAPFGGQSQPNFGDISATVDCFRNVSANPGIPRADVVPEIPNHVANFQDISAVVGSFRGFAFPFVPPACP